MGFLQPDQVSELPDADDRGEEEVDAGPDSDHRIAAILDVGALRLA